jgi:hypothetical protein
MAIDWEAFATGYLEQTARNQEEAKQDARNYEQRQRDTAERNAMTISKRNAVANQVVSLTNMLRDNGASQAVIQAAISAGPQAVVDLSNKVAEATQIYGRKLNEDDMEALVNMPENFSVIDMDTEDFIKKTYGLGYQGAGVTTEKPERTFMDRLTGRKAREIAQYNLDSEIMQDGLTAYDINQMAQQQDYESLVPGTFITFNDVKYFNPATDLGNFTRNINNIIDSVKGSPEYESYSSAYQDAFVNDNEEGMASAKATQQKLFEDALSSTIESMYSQYGDSFLEAASPVLKPFVSKDYLNRISSEPEEEEQSEEADNLIAAMTEPPEMKVPQGDESGITDTSREDEEVIKEDEASYLEGPSAEGEPPKSVREKAQEKFGFSKQEVEYILDSNQATEMDMQLLVDSSDDILDYINEGNYALTTTGVVEGLTEWAQENKKQLPFNLNFLVSFVINAIKDSQE